MYFYYFVISSTIFYLKEILSKEIPAEGRRGRSLSDHESPKKTMGAEDVRGRSAEDHVIKKNSPAAAEDARGRCSRNMRTEYINSRPAANGCLQFRNIIILHISPYLSVLTCVLIPPSFSFCPYPSLLTLPSLSFPPYPCCLIPASFSFSFSLSLPPHPSQPRKTAAEDSRGRCLRKTSAEDPR